MQQHHQQIDCRWKSGASGGQSSSHDKAEQTAATRCWWRHLKVTPTNRVQCRRHYHYPLVSRTNFFTRRSSWLLAREEQTMPPMRRATSTNIIVVCTNTRLGIALTKAPTTQKPHRLEAPDLRCGDNDTHTLLHDLLIACTSNQMDCRNAKP